MRPVRILLVAIALLAVGLTGWALGSRGGYGQPGADPAIAEAPPPPAPHDPAAPDDPAAGGGDTPSVGDDASGGGNPPVTTEPPARPTPKPVIQRISTVPAAPHIGGALHLPDGAGQVTFRVQMANATRAQFWLTPRGTGVRDQAVWLGEDRDGGDGWTARLRYADQPLLAHLVIRATGPGGAVEEFVGVVHNDPAQAAEGATEEVAEEP
jgi:hypothetical protein